MEYTLQHGVLPFLIFVGEQFTVHGSHRLLDAGRRVAVEVDGEGFCEVPCQRELAVPYEVLADRHRQLEIDIGLRAGLHLVVVA